MTTIQDEVTNIETLKAEAKELGVTGWQAMKDPEKLKAKIEDAKAGASRSVAPKMVVTTSGGNDRNSVLSKLEKENPGVKYLTQSSKLTPAEAAAKGFEIVRKDNGDILYCGNDIIVRTDKQSYNEWQQARNDNSLQAMKSIDKDLSNEGGGRKIQAVTERAKKGVDPE